MARDDLQVILGRIARGRHTQADLDALVQACRAGQVAIVTGERAVALGGDASDAVIVTGDNNVVIQVLHGTPAETVKRIPSRQLPAVAPGGTNPFEYGPAVSPERFYGRADQRADIKGRIGSVAAQCISIVGLRRSGKSSLLRYVRERIGEFCSPDQQALLVSIDMQDQRFHTPAGLLEGLRRAIERQIGAASWRSDQNGDPWAVNEGLEALRDGGRRLVVLIDEFERIGARLDQFQDWGEDWRAKASAGCLAMVIGTTRPLPEVYRACGLTSPFDNIFTSTLLGAFKESEWQALVDDGFARGGGAASVDDIRLIDDLAGGLPFYTQMAAALLWQHRDHLHATAAFAQQAAPRFAELWGDLAPTEHQALRYAVDVPGIAVPDPPVTSALHQHGLLRADGQPFSSAFAAFVRAQR
jgi:hypothetical protein